MESFTQPSTKPQIGVVLESKQAGVYYYISAQSKGKRHAYRHVYRYADSVLQYNICERIEEIPADCWIFEIICICEAEGEKVDIKSHEFLYFVAQCLPRYACDTLRENCLFKISQKLKKVQSILYLSGNTIFQDRAIMEGTVASSIAFCQYPEQMDDTLKRLIRGVSNRALVEIEVVCNL